MRRTIEAPKGVQKSNAGRSNTYGQWETETSYSENHLEIFVFCFERTI